MCVVIFHVCVLGNIRTVKSYHPYHKYYILWYLQIVLSPCSHWAHPHYLTVHSCMSCTSAVCIVALLVATINSSVAETRILPAFVSASPQRVGPERKAKELFTQPFVLVRPQCLPRRECPSWRALPCVGGWVGGVEWSGVGWGGVAGQNWTNLQIGRWRRSGRSTGRTCAVWRCYELRACGVAVPQNCGTVCRRGRGTQDRANTWNRVANIVCHKVCVCVYRDRCVHSTMHVCVEGLLNWPTGRRPRDTRSQEARASVWWDCFIIYILLEIQSIQKTCTERGSKKQLQNKTTKRNFSVWVSCVSVPPHSSSKHLCVYPYSHCQCVHVQVEYSDTLRVNTEGQMSLLFLFHWNTFPETLHDRPLWQWLPPTLPPSLPPPSAGTKRHLSYVDGEEKSQHFVQRPPRSGFTKSLTGGAARCFYA